MKERTTILLEPGVLRELKRIAAEEGRTLTSVIGECIREAINRARERSRRKRPRPTLTTHDLGRLPFDVSSRRAMYDALDEEDGDRLR